MTTYQVSPYLFSARVRGSVPPDLRPLDDLDAKGTSLHSLLAKTLTAARKKGPFSFPHRDDVTYSVTTVKAAQRSVYFVITQGSRGIESTISENGTLLHKRKPGHVEEIAFRCLAVFPKHGKHAIVALERVGNNGVAGFLQKLVPETLRTMFHDVVTEFRPLVTAADVADTKLRLNAISFRFPEKTDPDGKRLDMGPPAGFLTVNYRFRAAKKLTNFTDANNKKIEPHKVFGVLSDQLSETGFASSATGLLEMGVHADMHVTLPSGNDRTFTLGVQDGPALAYGLTPGEPGVASGSVARRIRPSDQDFIRVCKEILTDIEGTYSVKESTQALCEIPNKAKKIAVPESWKVVWSVPDHTAPASS